MLPAEFPPWEAVYAAFKRWAYRGSLIEWVESNSDAVLEIVKRNDDVRGFKLSPKRWIVERTLGRITKDFHPQKNL